MSRLLSFAILVVTTVAAPLQDRASAPSVTISNGTVVGSSLAGIDTFNGIPFAQPPVGPLRLKPPQSLGTSFGTLSATGIPKSCPQFYFQVNTTNLPSDTLGFLLDTPYGQEVSDSSEDCLMLNVIRPSTAGPSSKKLPVVFWIFGGGFELGSTSMYNGANFVQKSIQLGEPVIYVAVNYRVAGFGFLAGSDLAKEGSTNLGLRDQRLGMQWVAENIANFGGDSTKVTIWGESAGSISVFDQTIINGGDNSYNGKALFRGAIMDSGSIVPADPVTAPQAEAIYGTVVQSAGCSGASDKLACLRSVDYTTFLNAVNSVPNLLGYRSIDLAYLPRPDVSDSFFSQSPELSVEAGKFAKVPVIIGDQQDEGTLFALFQGNISTNAELIQYLATYFPGNPDAVSDVTNLLSNYPDQPLLGQPQGSPFNTGSLNNIYPQFKRLAAVLGDITFTLARRAYLDTVSSQVKSWSYISTYLYGLPVLGTFHGTDLLYAYGYLSEVPEPTVSIQTYYINFINNLDPNAIKTTAPLINWPQYSSSSPQLLDFGAAANSLMKDNFRTAAYNYLSTHISSFRV